MPEASNSCSFIFWLHFACFVGVFWLGGSALSCVINSLEVILLHVSYIEILNHCFFGWEPCAKERWSLFHIWVGKLFRDAQTLSIIIVGKSLIGRSFIFLIFLKSCDTLRCPCENGCQVRVINIRFMRLFEGWVFL